jgi:hypothetical protein
MLHACFYTICLVFHYTAWLFYAISGTNLLTRCHSASFLFSAVFVFQKWYTGNILGIGQNKSEKSYFTRKLPEIRRGVGGGPQGPHTPWWHSQAPGRASHVLGHLVHPLTSPLVTTQNFIKFWGEIFVFILLVLIENSQGFKTFWVYLKASFENYLKFSIYFLKNFFGKDPVLKCYFLSPLVKPYSALCKLACKRLFYKICFIQ